MKKAYLKYYSHLIYLSKKDSIAPELYGIISVFFLSFINLVNFITVCQIIRLNQKFFKKNFPEMIYNFFLEYQTPIKLIISAVLIINNILLYKHAKAIIIEYNRNKSSIYVLSYFLISLMCWWFVMVYEFL